MRGSNNAPLFHTDEPLGALLVAGRDAIKARGNFIEICLQNEAFLAGRGDIKEAVADDVHCGKPKLPGSYSNYSSVDIPITDIR